MTTLSEIYDYYKARIREVINYSVNGDPWAFLMASSYIDYLVKLVYNEEPTTQAHYKKFIRDYLSLINNQYRDFTYSSGDKDLPEQMYHVLRCGIVHGYSLVPDKISIKKGGRKRSILLAHQKNGAIHFTKYNQNGYDGVIFTAENFAEDLEKVLDKIFLELVHTDNSLANNIIGWVNKYPPIMGIVSMKFNK